MMAKKVSGPCTLVERHLMILHRDNQQLTLENWRGHILPGCSRDDSRKTEWSMSTSMVQAYLVMKGPGADMEDPLMAWISKREGEALEDRNHGFVITEQ